MKTCIDCGLEKASTLEFFYKDNGNRDGLRARCIVCWAIKRAEYKVSHKEQERKKCQEWYQANKTECNTATKAYYAANKDILPDRTEYQADWYQNNKPKSVASYKKYMTRKTGQTPKWITEDQLKQIEHYYVVAKWVQSILGEQVDVDHIEPLQGKNISGLHVPWNLQLLTHRDNVIKGNR